jgi:alkylation response protein AidB-like acyl-CoA dehydrogenase
MRTFWSETESELREKFVELGAGIGMRASRFRQRIELDREMWAEVAAAGLFALPVAPEYGGQGKGWWSFAAAMEGLSSSAGDLGFLLSVIAHMGAIRILSEEGSEEQKRAYLPRLVAGEVASTATTEATGGSDVARIQASAREDGSALRLTGVKKHITNAPVADIFVILGRIPSLGEKRDITLFLMDREAPGLKTGPAEDTLGNTSSPTGDIILDNVLIGPGNIIGEAGDGLNSLYSMLTLDRLLYSLVAAGYLEPMVEEALRFSSQRSSFGRSLSEHQYVQDKIVLMKVSMEQSRQLAYAALDRMIHNHRDMLLMGSLAKLVGTEGLWQSAGEFLQLQGHQGYMQGLAAQILSDTAAVRIAGGTSEMQKINIFNQLSRRLRSERPAGSERVAAE